MSSVEVKSIHGGSHAIANRDDLNQWRCLKKVLDGASDTAESDMTDAFGCHGEPIANAISEALWGLEELLPEESEHKLKSYLLPHFQAICVAMTDVRSELDSAIDKMANEHKYEGWYEAIANIPSGCDEYASAHGVDLDTTLEQAFEAGVNAMSGCLDCCYPGSVAVSMEDL